MQLYAFMPNKLDLRISIKMQLLGLHASIAFQNQHSNSYLYSSSIFKFLFLIIIFFQILNFIHCVFSDSYFYLYRLFFNFF